MKLEINIKWNGQEVKIKGKNAMDLGVFRAGKVIQAQAVSLCPVDDGLLRNSLMTKTNKKTNFTRNGTVEISPPEEEMVAYVGTAVHYGPYQEFGTFKMHAQPFLRPAFDLSQGKALTVVEDEGRSQFKEYID